MKRTHTLSFGIELYQEDEESYFGNSGELYQLNYLWKKLEHAPIAYIAVNRMAWIAKDFVPDEDDEERIAKADLTAPLLVSLIDHRDVVVDGFHRLCRAIREKRLTLPYQRVSPQLLAEAKVSKAPEALSNIWSRW